MEHPQQQSRALSALAPYLALSKSATSPLAACNLITQATSAPHTYCFAELLQAPNIQALRQSGNEEHIGQLKLLEVFAWGTWGDYVNLAEREEKGSGAKMPKLNEAQSRKLKLLSLLTLVPSSSSSSSPRPKTTLAYAELLSALALPNAAALESLATTALSASLLTGHIDPVHERLDISAVAPLRDLAPGSVPGLSAELSAWEARCTAELKLLEEKVAGVRNAATERREDAIRAQRAFEREVARLEAERDVAGVIGVGKGKGGVAGGGAKRAASNALVEELEGDGDGEDAMDVDEGYFGGGGGGSGGSGGSAGGNGGRVLRGPKKVMSGGGSRVRWGDRE